VTEVRPRVGPDRVLIDVPLWVAQLRDPSIRACLGFVAFVVTGFVVLVLAWRGAAHEAFTFLQMPWVASGGLVGVALIGMGVGLLDVHLFRRAAAERRAQTDDLLRQVAHAAELIRRRATTPAAVPTRGRRRR
jgi:hypothetical protein